MGTQRGEHAPDNAIRYLVSICYKLSISEFEAAPPVLRVPPAAPATALLFEQALGGVGESGNTLDAALVGQRGTAGPRRLAVGEDLLASFGERDERGAPRGFIPSPAG